MEGKDAIIERILSDATEKAQALIDDAEKEATSRVTAAKDWADKYKSAQEKILNDDVREISFRRMTVAELDVRKLFLQAKQQVVSEVFDAVYDKLCSLDKLTYIKFTEKLISENADDGDEIVLAENDSVSEKDILALKVVKEKNLTVSKESGNFKGGVMLVGKLCDKDLSFERLIEDKKDFYMSKVVEKLFGQ